MLVSKIELALLENDNELSDYISSGFLFDKKIHHIKTDLASQDDFNLDYDDIDEYDLKHFCDGVDIGYYLLSDIISEYDTNLDTFLSNVYRIKNKELLKKVKNILDSFKSGS